MKTLIILLTLATLAPLHADTLIYTIRSGTANTPKERSVTLTPGTTLRVSGSGTLDAVSNSDFRAAIGLAGSGTGTIPVNSAAFTTTAGVVGVAREQISFDLVYDTEEFFNLSGGDGASLEEYLKTFRTYPYASTVGQGVVYLSGTSMISSGTNTSTAVTPSYFSAAWTWIKTQAQTISGAWTWTGNVIFGDAAGDSATINAGTVTAPNVTAATSSSLMTRELVDLSPLWSVGEVRQCLSPQVGASASPASAGIQVGDIGILSSGTAANGYGRVSLYRNVTTASDFTGGSIWLARQISVAGSVTLNITGTHAAARLVVGGSGAVPEAADAPALTGAGFGVEFGWQNSRAECRLFAHNGTSYVTSAWSNAEASGYHIITNFVVRSDGAGTISLHLSLNGRPSLTPTLTLSGGPTTIYSAGQYVDFVVVNSSSGGPALGGQMFNSILTVLP